MQKIKQERGIRSVGMGSPMILTYLHPKFDGLKSMVND